MISAPTDTHHGQGHGRAQLGVVAGPALGGLEEGLVHGGLLEHVGGGVPAPAPDDGGGGGHHRHGLRGGGGGHGLP